LNAKAFEQKIILQRCLPCGDFVRSIFEELPSTTPSTQGTKELQYMFVSKKRGTPTLMVYNGNPIKMDDLGGKPPIFGNPL